MRGPARGTAVCVAATMTNNGVAIDDTFAEAFGMRATRVVITAASAAWARHAAVAMTGFATSVIGCGCEAGIERELEGEATPDGRPGVSVLVFAVSRDELAKQVERRVGQCVLTSPTSAAYSGLDGDERIDLGRKLRYFGDGFQTSKLLGARRYWRIPVMDGEFVCEETAGVARAIGGGNLLIVADGVPQALAACEAAIAAMRGVEGVIMPFPGGVVRSGSKIGSKYAALPASTNDAFCPTLAGITKTALDSGAQAVLEIVIDGLTEQAVRSAMREGIGAICAIGAAGGVRRITAGNYGGKLGKFRFPLREIAA
jgi:formylmethanofuran--tetrahydromethanopterin N-formyltransferase